MHEPGYEYDVIPVTFGIETYEEFVKDARDMMPRHWEEVGASRGKIRFDPDYDFYKKASDNGMVVFYTAREWESHELVGYAIYFVNKNPHAKTVKWAASDAIVVRSDARNKGIGRGLIEKATNDLTRRGCGIMQTMTKINHPELGKLLESEGHKAEDITYTKLLGEYRA
jgi:GNAT superfamily N-acetyltransferase